MKWHLFLELIGLKSKHVFERKYKPSMKNDLSYVKDTYISVYMYAYVAR